MRGFAAIGLWNPKTAANVGSALRAAHCYDVSLVAIQGERYRRSHTDTTKAWRHIPMLQTPDLLESIPYDAVPVAIELVEGARSLVSYTHPERAYYLFGPEDGSLPPKLVAKCRDVIYVPTEHCMNLAACVNVVLYDRRAKQIQRESSLEPARPRPAIRQREPPRRAPAGRPETNGRACADPPCRPWDRPSRLPRP